MFGIKDRRLSILDRFLKTEVGQELVRREEEELQGQREHAAEVLATFEREAAETLPALARKVEQAKAALDKAQQVVADCKRDFLLAELAQIEAANRIESGMAQSRTILHDSAPACVSEYLAELLDYYSRIRRSSEQLPEIKGDEVPGNFSAGHEQRKRLIERWEHTLAVREFHQLVRDTIAIVKAMFAQPLTAEQAAKETESHRRVIAKAQKAAGIVLN